MPRTRANTELYFRLCNTYKAGCVVSGFLTTSWSLMLTTLTDMTSSFLLYKLSQWSNLFQSYTSGNYPSACSGTNLATVSTMHHYRYLTLCTCTMSCIFVQWNLNNMDTTGTLPNCPYYSGILSSEVVRQATPLNQQGSPASLKLLRQQKKAQRRLGREWYLDTWRFSLVNQPFSW